MVGAEGFEATLSCAVADQPVVPGDLACGSRRPAAGPGKALTEAHTSPDDQRSHVQGHDGRDVKRPKVMARVRMPILRSSSRSTMAYSGVVGHDPAQVAQGSHQACAGAASAAA